MSIILDGTSGITTPSITSPLQLTNVALAGTPVAGQFEYNGTAPYFTPLGTQRGVIPAEQFYRLDSNVAGLNATGAQSILGVGVTLVGSTVYQFQGEYYFLKTAGTTSHVFNLGFGGTATFNNIYYSGVGVSLGTSTWNYQDSALSGIAFNTATLTATTTASSTAGVARTFRINGTVSVNAGGTFIPQYSLSVAPGGAFTTLTGSYFKISPLGASGANTSIGTWA